ncbi:uncharacterized protein J4E79_003833 [Alternaria viburni]|uniref:uncharacterized protein n=1 Tax=Alternaria viburni TaxID=566460 RepID=UPI0020C1E7B5|nr:uncharacterized protein J4E79_003833 [Alternaria viburni]KAI4664329.1 hypothetical protein J4E79_003833 [Alternaria viburni]
MAALSFQPFVLRLFNAPLGVDFLRNLSAKISPFFNYEHDRLFAYISDYKRRNLRRKMREKRLEDKRHEKQQQRAEEREKQQKNNSWKERNREAQMKLKAKILQKKKST